MAGVYGDNSSLCSREGVMVELCSSVGSDADCVLSVRSPGTGELQSPVSGSTPRVVSGARMKTGGVLQRGSDLAGSWSCDEKSVTLSFLADSSEYYRKNILFDEILVGCDANIVDEDAGEVLVGAITADGHIHAITVFIKGSAGIGNDFEGRMSSETFLDISGHKGLSCSISGLCVVGRAVCIGRGNSIVCFSVGHGGCLNRDTCVTLGEHHGILGNVASYLGLSSGVAFAPVMCMTSVTVTWQQDSGGVVKKDFLFSIQEDSMLCVWDVESGSLVHSVSLLAGAQAQTFAPSCLDFSPDFLNPGGIFLIASFQEKGTENEEETGPDGAGEVSGGVTSIVSLFEVMVEDRNGVLNVHIENGPHLPDVRGNIVSSSIEFMGSSKYRLWLVMESNAIECIAFKGDTRGNHTSSHYVVETLEMRLNGLLPSSEVEREILKMLYVDLERIMLGQKRNHTMRRYMLDTVCQLPTSSKAGLVEAARQVRVPMVSEDLMSLEILETVQEWINDSESDIEVFEKAYGFLGAFLASICVRCSPRAVQVIQMHPSDTKRLIVVGRGDGNFSFVVEASEEEALSFDAACSALVSGTKDCLGLPALSLVRYALCHGVPLRNTLVPLLVNLVHGKSHVSAVEFGKHHTAVRKAFRAFSMAKVAVDVSCIAEKVISLSAECSKEDEVWGKRYNRPASDFVLDIARTALEGCTRSRLDLALQLLVIEASRHSERDLYERLISSLGPTVLSHWSCTMPMVDGGSVKSEPLVPQYVAGDLTSQMDDRLSSKRFKRLLLEGKQLYAFHLAVGLHEKLSHTCKDGSLLSMDHFIRLVLNDFTGPQNTMRYLLHAIMRNEHVINKEQMFDSLLGVIEAVEGSVKDVEMVFFKGYNLSKRCSEAYSGTVLHMDDRARFEQEGLGLMLRLCDIDDSNTADLLRECVISLTGKDPGGALTSESYIDTITEILEQLGCSFSTTRSGLFAARLQETMGSEAALEKGARSMARVYKALEEQNHMEEAYSVALSIKEPQRRLDCVKGLVGKLCSLRQIDVLCTLPLIALQDGEDTQVLDQVILALWDRASKESIDSSNTYFVLFDLYVSRGNYQSAAAALLYYCRRLTNESELGKLEKLLRSRKILIMVAGCLKLVHPSDAWLEDSAAGQDIRSRESWASPGRSMSMKYMVPKTITVDEIEKECVMVKCLIKLVCVKPEFDVNSATHHDLLAELLERGFFQEAWTLASVLAPNDLQSSKELIIFKMSKDAYSLKCSELETKLEALIAGESVPVADRLRLAAAEAILEADDTTSLPHWLVEPYISKYTSLSTKSSHQTEMADSAGMIRVLLHYGRAHLAGSLALALLDPYISSIPSMSLPRIGSVSVPHDLIANVLVSLGVENSDSAKLLHSRLQDAVQKCRTAADEQTKALSALGSM
jgi:hypothetical protein